MATSILINGAKLDEVSMPMVPSRPGVTSALSYPAGQILVTREAGALRVAVPAYLAVELYRVGILPQNAGTPVEVEYGGRGGQYVVSDVRYADANAGAFGRVTFTLSALARSHVARSSRSGGGQQRTAVITDLTHYLDESGEVSLDTSAATHKLAVFQTRLVEATTARATDAPGDSGVRCRTRACRGTVHSRLEPATHGIEWCCPACGHHGVIGNWQQTRWDRRPK